MVVNTGMEQELESYAHYADPSDVTLGGRIRILYRAVVLALKYRKIEQAPMVLVGCNLSTPLLVCLALLFLR